MSKYVVRVLLSAILLGFFSMGFVLHAVSAAQEETIVGTVVKSGKGFAIEADDGDYIVKGKDLSKLVGKLVEVTGIVTESEKGDVIDVKSAEEIQE